MAESAKQSGAGATPPFKPYVPASETTMPEFTWPAVITGTVLGIIFSASSMYLVLKVGMTVSASIPIAVLSVSLFRGLSAMTQFSFLPSFLRLRRATILETSVHEVRPTRWHSLTDGPRAAAARDAG